MTKLLVCLILLTSFGLHATVVTDFRALKAALDANESGAGGDMIICSYGTYTFTTGIGIYTKAFTLRGQDGGGTNQVIFACGSTSYPFQINPGPGVMQEMYWIKFIGNCRGGYITTGGNMPGTPTGGRYDLHDLNMPEIDGRGISPGATDSFGKIRGCYFASSNGNFTMISPFGNEYKSWANDTPMGTSNLVEVYDCYFYTPTNHTGNGFFDCYNGASVDFHNNFFDGSAANGCHGYDSQVTSCRFLGIHNNIFTNLNRSMDWLQIRGGVACVYSNEIWGSSKPAANLKYYRGASASGLQGGYGFNGHLYSVTYSTNFADGDQAGGFTRPGYPTQHHAFGSRPFYTFKSTLPTGNRFVLIGATLGDSLSNLAAAVNRGPGAGTKYSSATVQDWDFRMLSNNATTIWMTNINDGPGLSGYPAAMAPGVVTVAKYTNSGTVVYGCYSYANTFHPIGGGPTSAINWSVEWSGDFTHGTNTLANLLQSGRDYFDNTLPPYVTGR